MIPRAEPDATRTPSSCENRNHSVPIHHGCWETLSPLHNLSEFLLPKLELAGCWEVCGAPGSRKHSPRFLVETASPRRAWEALRREAEHMLGGTGLPSSGRDVASAELSGPPLLYLVDKDPNTPAACSLARSSPGSWETTEITRWGGNRFAREEMSPASAGGVGVAAGGQAGSLWGVSAALQPRQHTRFHTLPHTCMPLLAFMLTHAAPSNAHTAAHCPAPQQDTGKEPSHLQCT